MGKKTEHIVIGAKNKASNIKILKRLKKEGKVKKFSHKKGEMVTQSNGKKARLYYEYVER